MDVPLKGSLISIASKCLFYQEYSYRLIDTCDEKCYRGFVALLQQVLVGSMAIESIERVWPAT